MDIHGDLQIRDAIGEKKSEEIGIGDFDGDLEAPGGRILIGLEQVEVENGFDVLRVERALDVAILQLLDELGPRVPGTEVEPELREVGLGFGEGDMGNGEFENS